MTDNRLEVSVEDGKYTYVQPTKGGAYALRYGEHWRDLCGDNFVGALAYEVDELRIKVAFLEKRIEDRLTIVDELSRQNDELLLQIASQERYIADLRVSDKNWRDTYGKLETLLATLLKQNKELEFRLAGLEK